MKINYWKDMKLNFKKVAGFTAQSPPLLTEFIKTILIQKIINFIIGKVYYESVVQFKNL